MSSCHSVSVGPPGFSPSQSMWPPRQCAGHQVESLLWKHHSILLWGYLGKWLIVCFIPWDQSHDLSTVNMWKMFCICDAGVGSHLPKGSSVYCVHRVTNFTGVVSCSGHCCHGPLALKWQMWNAFEQGWKSTSCSVTDYIHHVSPQSLLLLISDMY